MSSTVQSAPADRDQVTEVELKERPFLSDGLVSCSQCCADCGASGADKEGTYALIGSGDLNGRALADD